MGADRSLAVDPKTGQIKVETERYLARFDGGVLTYLYSKPGKIAFIGGETPPAAMANRTGLYAEDEPKAEPFWLLPVLDGTERSAVSAEQKSELSCTVTYKGLVKVKTESGRFEADKAAVAGLAKDDSGTKEQSGRSAVDDKGGLFRSDAVLQLSVSVDEKSGDLLVSTAGSTVNECLVGSGFAFSGIMPKFVFYATKGCGLRQENDPDKNYFPLNCTLEWGNYTMSKRPGLSGELWNVPVTVIGSVEQPHSVFSIWCEDDEPFYKFFAGSKDGVTYATYSHTPYAENRKTQSVVWRINVFDGGWTEAAKPFAESMPRRGFTKTRAPWAKEISVIVQVSDLADSYLKPLEDLFPPEDRHHVMLYVQAWRKAGFDKNMWDYEPTDGFKSGAPKARADGFHVLAYMNPMICWGDASKIEDPELQAKVKEFKANGELDPINLELLPYAVHLNLALKSWREYHWSQAANLISKYGIDGIYLDCTYQTLPDGRGNIDGMNAYQGMKEYLDGLRRIKPDLYIGTEKPNELIAWGADFGLHTALEWNKGNEEGKARKTHPIVNYLLQHVMTSMIHTNNPYHYIRTVRHYHLSEEIAERSGQVAAMGYEPSFNSATETPSIKLWKHKARLFARRGIHPVFPEKWEPNVMSYYRAEDGTGFVFEETDYGSKFVERAKEGPIVHYARAWKKTSFKTSDGKMLGWIGQADDGTYIGLDNVDGAYVLFPDAETDPRLRIAELPENTRIVKFRMTDDIAAIELAAPDQAQPARIRFAFSKKPFRVAAPGQPNIPLDGDGAATIPANGPIAVIWTDGVIAPFEYAGRYIVPLPKDLTGTPDKPVRFRIGGEWDQYMYRFVEKSDEWDQTWNSTLAGPHNPRPGTIYQFSFKVRRSEKTDAARGEATAASHLSTWGTGVGSFFRAFGDRKMLKLEGDEPATVTNAGVRNADFKYGQERIMTLCAGGNANLSDFSPIEFVRPELAVSDLSPINLGTVKPGEKSAESQPREISNCQRWTTSSGNETFRTVLYGTAHIKSDKDKPYLQTIDDVGAVLVGENASLFELVPKNVVLEENSASDGQGVKLIGEDGLPGLAGGEKPESESFTVRFRGADKPGKYSATVRIATQAGNMGALSKGGVDEPLAGIYYSDIPVSVAVLQN